MAVARTKPGRRVRTPMRLQLEATECGAASLAIVLEFFGSFVPLSVLREQCGVSRDGSKAANVLKAARSYGLEARGFRKEPNDVSRMAMPVIVHWNFNHFLVVEGFSKKYVYLNDPALGRYRVLHDEFDRAFTGVVLSLQPTDGFVPSGRRPSVWPSILRHSAGMRRAFVLLTFAGLLLAVPSLTLPLLSKVFVDEILIGGRDDWLLPLLGAMLLAAALQAALVYLQKSRLLRTVVELGVQMSGRFVWHALRLPVSFFFARSPGDIAGRVALNDAVGGSLSGRLSTVLSNLLLVAFYGGLLFCLSPSVALIGVITVALELCLLQTARAKRIELGRITSRHRSNMVAVGAGGLQMIETIKATAAENEFFAHWAGHQAKLAIVQQDAARHEQVMLTLGSLLAHLNTLVVLCAGAVQVIGGQMTVGTLVAVQLLMRGFVQPAQGLSQVGAELQRLRGDLERLDDVLLHEADPSVARAADRDWQPARLAGGLELRSVSFGFLRFVPPLIRGLGLRIAPGERVALVGGTGSGKSTLAKLVAGLYRPWEGEILFDGRPVCDRRILANSVALVDQDVTLFEGTVRDNLTLWDPTIPQADMVQAAKDACIHEDITKLSGGYDAVVTEGGLNFSGGQRQRLELARALVRQPALLVLDEATSALDPETELQVDKNLRRRGCSFLIVAHRLSTIRDCDEIIVIERGSVVQRGSHERLLAEPGPYRHLITAE